MSRARARLAQSEWISRFVVLPFLRQIRSMTGGIWGPERKGDMRFFRLLMAVLLLTAGSANAAYTINMYQNGPDVVATGSGTINLTGLAGAGAGGTSAIVRAFNATLVVGTSTTFDAYNGFVGPVNFGGGAAFTASSYSGNGVGFNGSINRVVVPQGYVSGSALASSSTWNGATIAGLGLTVGTYTWNWAGDSLTLIISLAPPVTTVAPVPTLSEWGVVALAVLLGLLGLMRTRRKR